MNLFEQQEQRHVDAARPLAARMRPRTLEEFAGQQHFLGEGKLLRRMLAADRLTSVIFYGPPGTGKTTLASLIAEHTSRHFTKINAAASGVKELRELLSQAQDRLAADGIRTVVFIDELHRFNRSQQDVLLPDVESGAISLVGATTSNPFFALVAPLISRSQVFEFIELSQSDLESVIRRALSDKEQGLGSSGVDATDEAIEFLADVSDGDARRALTSLEIGVLSLQKGETFDLEVAQESIQKKAVRYDSTGDDHYNAASAFIKSIRGSDPDAALYWMAVMIEAGEDPRFIARRIVISASEDIGNADPQALVLANAAAQATEFVGLPECRIILSQAVTYLATAPKSNASYVAIDRALADIRNHAVIPVPKHLRDAHYQGAEALGNGEDYQYAHSAEDGWVDQDYLGVDKTYYEPVDRGHEATILQRMKELASRRSSSES